MNAALRGIEIGSLVQHIDGRQGRVRELILPDRLGGLIRARVAWFRGPVEEVLIGYIWATKMEENWDD